MRHVTINRKSSMAKHTVTPANTRLAALLLHSAADYRKYQQALSHSENDRAREGWRHQRHQAELLTAFKRPVRQTGLVGRWREASDLDKVTAAALALWHGLPGTPHLVTLNFDHKYKKRSFSALRDETTRLLRKHRITHFWIAFELSRASPARLHCHGMINLPRGVCVNALATALQSRFGRSPEIRRSLRGGNKIVEIRQAQRAPTECRSPDYWASYAMGDAWLTKAQTGWKSVHYICKPLIPAAAEVYKWLSQPTLDALPFELTDVPTRSSPSFFEQARLSQSFFEET